MTWLMQPLVLFDPLNPLTVVPSLLPLHLLPLQRLQLQEVLLLGDPMMILLVLPGPGPSKLTLSWK